MKLRLLGLAILLLGLPAAAALGAQDAVRPQGFAGRPLSSVLRTLQARGLKIVFSTEVVRPSMRVETEPRGKVDRQVLDEVLLPHGLEVRPAPRGVLLVVRRGPARVDGPERVTAIIRGLVVDAQSATPLPGVLVRLAAGGRETISDEDGRFEFSGVTAGPHRLYVSAVGYSLAEPELTVAPGGPLELTVALASGTGTYTEEVNVVGDPFRGAAVVVPSAATLTSADLRELRGVLTDDPFRAVQSMPSVMAGNDLRSEFSIRGSDFRHVGLTIDGMAAGWPVHSVRGDLGGGSVGLINADVIESVTVAAGAYPQEQPARSGGWMELTLREGSRSRTQAHASVSMTAASLVTEGPLGSSGRGSWLVSARQSFLQWILARSDADGTAFGYTDVLGKVVFDLTPRQQVQFTAIAGRSLLDIRRVDPDPNLVTRGSASSGVYNAAWRTTFSPRATLVQRIGFAADGFTNDGAFTAELGDGTGRELSYRADATVAAGPTFGFGVQAQRQTVDQAFTKFIGFADQPRARRDERIEGRRSVLTAYARASATIKSTVVIDGGGLAVASDGTRLSPWAAAAIPVFGWTLRAAGGIYRQLPGLDQAASSFAPAPLRPEWSRHVDVSIERRWRGDMRAQIAVYRRDERDLLRLVGDEFRLEEGVIVLPSLTPAWQNAERATGRGLEVVVQRRAARGLTGWVSYAWSRVRQDDAVAGGTFAGDFDQRHTFSAFALYRLSAVTALSGKLRIGNNFPVVGYLEQAGDDTRVGPERNQVQLPVYARLDLRANRAFNLSSRRITLFAEIVNVLGRSNDAAACACLGWADAPQVRSDGRVTGTTQQLFPFLPTLGVVVDF
jgi:hypothetical protein